MDLFPVELGGGGGSEGSATGSGRLGGGGRAEVSGETLSSSVGVRSSYVS